MNMDKDISRMGLQNLQVLLLLINNNDFLTCILYIARATASSYRGFYIE